MINYSLYGICSNNLEFIRKVVEQALGIIMIAHDSSYFGEYYLFRTSAREEIRLVKNCDTFGEWLEEEFPNIPLLLYVSTPNRAHEIEQLLVTKIEGLSLLWRKEF